MDRDTNILMGQTDRKTTRQTDLPLDKVIISHVHATKILQFKVKYNPVISCVRCLFFKLVKILYLGKKLNSTSGPTDQPIKQPTMFSIVKYTGNKVGDVQLLNF